MNFKTWIKRFEKEQNAIGDLARDIALDVDFPAVGSMESLRSHLNDKNATPRVIEVFEKAWHNYEEDLEEGHKILNEEAAQENDNEEDSTPSWESRAEGNVTSALKAAQWDFANKVVAIPSEENGEERLHVFKTRDELHAYLCDVAVQGWNESVPWDGGAAFECDEMGYADDGLMKYEEQLNKMGWE